MDACPDDAWGVVQVELAVLCAGLMAPFGPEDSAASSSLATPELYAGADGTLEARVWECCTDRHCPLGLLQMCSADESRGEGCRPLKTK